LHLRKATMQAQPAADVALVAKTWRISKNTRTVFRAIALRCSRNLVDCPCHFVTNR
jgi:hypothetical protein